MKELTIQKLAEIPALATTILEEAGSARVFLFFATMGMGKTTLIKELCKQLGVKENVSSPTFSIVNEYDAGGKPIYHFDFYRLKDEQEAFDLGYEEYFYSNHYCFVEWPEKIENLIPESAVSISITGNEKEQRRILIQFPEKNK